MQKLQPVQNAATLDGRTPRETHPGFDFLSGWPDTPGMFVRVLNFAAADFVKQPKPPSRWPQIKKLLKVVRLVETVKIAFGLVFIRDRLLTQTWPARCSQILPNSLGKFGPNKSELD